MHELINFDAQLELGQKWSSNFELTVAIPDIVQLSGTLSANGSGGKGRSRCSEGKGGDSGLHGDKLGAENWLGGDGERRWKRRHARKVPENFVKYTPFESIHFGKYFSSSKTYA